MSNMDKVDLATLAMDVAERLDRDVRVLNVRALPDNPNLAIVLAARRMPAGYEHLRYCTWLMNAYDPERPFFAHGVYDLDHNGALKSYSTRK